jgi:hypothetical protein
MRKFQQSTQGVDTIEPTRILLASRHELTLAQYQDLKKIFPDGFEIIHRTGNIRSAQEVKEIMQANTCTEVIAVTNPNVLAELVTSGIYPLRACMGRRHETKNGQAPRYEHLYFTRIRECTLQEEKLT